MEDNTRRQLTLFVQSTVSEAIESARNKFNPKQFELIKAHVTLCREDEIFDLNKVLSNLRSLQSPELVLEFGEIVRFDDGKGVLMPSVGDRQIFDNLRFKILQGVVENPRKQEAHITLMHPRNSIVTDSVFLRLQKIELPRCLKFNTVSLIEQKGTNPWRTLDEFKFARENDPL